MGVDRPYRRTVRQFVEGEYNGNGRGGSWKYIKHPQYAESPEHYIRAFLLIQKDMQEIFDFVEPADANLKCYSFRIHEIFIRACVEVEANCKAILKENGYTKNSDLNMTDYKKIEQSHRLSSYSVRLPIWHGTENERRPFDSWSDPSSKKNSLPWYSDYHSIKHDRPAAFEKASFKNMIDAVSGLVVLLSAQFLASDSPERVCPMNTVRNSVRNNVSDDDTELAIGDYFRIQFPDDWPVKERYDFDWYQLKNEDDPFQQYPY